MRLLDTRSEKLVLMEFEGDVIEPYAILSHTWGSDEVLFADIGKEVAEKKAGHRKIRYALDQAARDNLNYLWVDTCCIDKSSSADLSEAINSMFSWYAGADVCYAYLSDIEDKDGDLAQSRWFTRGWTLQELLAPEEIKFFTCGWRYIGSKNNLATSIARITGIDYYILRGTRSLFSASVARRMSWAARRETTRIEDQAYCLLGIFGVNMPLLYGEREKAFIRLQEEIIKIEDDQSLFAWTDPKASENSYGGMLAWKPLFFAASGDIVPCDYLAVSEPHSITNGRLKLEVCIKRFLPKRTPKDLYVPQEWALLNCRLRGRPEEMLAVQVVSFPRYPKHYRRYSPATILSLPRDNEAVTLYIPPMLRASQDTYVYRNPIEYFVRVNNIIVNKCWKLELRKTSGVCKGTHVPAFPDEILVSRLLKSDTSGILATNKPICSRSMFQAYNTAVTLRLSVSQKPHVEAMFDVEIGLNADCELCVRYFGSEEDMTMLLSHEILLQGVNVDGCPYYVLNLSICPSLTGNGIIKTQEIPRAGAEALM